MTRILLTGAGGSAAQNFLACLRLVAPKYWVAGADINRWHLEWGKLDLRLQSPRADDPRYLDWLRRIIEAHRVEFIHGQPDVEVLFLARHADQLPAATFLPDAAVVELCQDKWRSLLRWQEAGLREDDLDLVRGPGDPEPPARTYPCWMRARQGTGSRGACLVLSREYARHWMAVWMAANGPVDWIFEDHLPGPEYSWHALWRRGKLIVSSAREYVEKPMQQQLGALGVSSSYIVARATHDEEVNIAGMRAVLALDPEPHGAYGVDLRRDAQGVVRPTEVNAGRFKTTSLFLARAGANMPHWFVHLGLGHDLPHLPQWNAVPEGWCWIRHMDCAPVLVHESRLRSLPLEESACPT